MAKLEPRIDIDSNFMSVALDLRRIPIEAEYGSLDVLPAVSAVRSWRYVYMKRLADIVVSLTMLACVLIPCLLIALLIAFTSEGPVFYRETRIGQGGRPFRIWKFRTMCKRAEWKEVLKAKDASGTLLHWRVHKQPGDPRITPVGRVLRRWSLDELPQLLNVLLGDMSLVGPRPVVEAEMPLYRHLQAYYLAAIPGLSGLWQISGRSNINFAKRADLDATYVRNWSLRNDLAILIQTLPAVCSRVGAR